MKAFSGDGERVHKNLKMSDRQSGKANLFLPKKKPLIANSLKLSHFPIQL
jgi:hypothetical protein